MPDARSELVGDRTNDQGRQPFYSSFLHQPRSNQSQPVLPSVADSGTSASSLEGAEEVAMPIARLPAGKRMLDAICIALTIPMVLPLVLLLALYIKLVSPGPILFRQERVGYREGRFQMLKFRSMRVNADPGLHESHTTQLLKANLPLTKMDERGDDRLIPLGRLLRSSGLDELPQLLNVLRGEMSIVGPRPCTGYEFALLNERQRARFRALPGITGLWQVSGKNKTTFQQMIDLDTAYADHWSIALDLKIMARTIPVLCHQITEILRNR